MKVTVRYFASIREAAGVPEESVELVDGATLSTLKELLLTHHPELEKHWELAIISVNKTYTKLDIILKDGDEVGILPPISGG